MNVVISVLYEADRLEAAQLRWALRAAVLHGGNVTVLVPATEKGAKVAAIDLDPGAEGAPAERELRNSLRELLDAELTPKGWVAASRKSPGTDAPSHPDERGSPGFALRRVPTDRIAAEVSTLLEDPRRDLCVGAVGRLPDEGTVWRTLTRELLRDLHCEVALVVSGQRQDGGELFFLPARQQYARGASRLALRLAQRYHRKATALWVNPEIGSEAESVGRRTLDRVLADALGEEAGRVARRVEVQDPPERGILAVCAEERFEVVIMGIAEFGAGGFAEARVPIRVARGTDQTSLILTRGALPARTRLQRILDFQLRRIVPQLEREERTAFVDRVQSSSKWNFDFIALMGLATGIATLGLIGDSGAVIIGAMLVAPLMTPLMGIGLSIDHGNLRLAGMTGKTAFLGFLLAFVIAFCIGVVDSEFGIATSEMYARHWPNLVDFNVAFVAGMAAAYASGRPGLLAALPGVAIAASLVPPIATSGLAVSIGHYGLALGAILLFLVNVVAIVVASALVLWAVGLRSRKRLELRARLFAVGVVAVAVATALGLALSTPRSAPPLALVDEIKAEVGKEYRVRDVILKHGATAPVLQIDLGGPVNRHPKFSEELKTTARKYLGDDVTVRLTYRHEDVVE